MADPKIKYDIEAAVTGEEDVDALAKKMRDFGDVLEGDLKTSADAAAQALEALGSKQRAVEAFRALNSESRTLSGELDKAVGTVDRLGNELQESATKTQAMAAAEKTAGAALAESQASLQRKREALRTLREETTGAARREDEYRAAVIGLTAGIKAANAEVKERQQALRAAAQVSGTAQTAEAALRKEYDVSVGAAARLSGELRNKNAALTTARETMQGMGMATSNLAQQERNLQGAVAQVRTEVAAMAPAYQQAAAASSASTQVQAKNQRTLRDGMGEISAQLQRIQSIALVAVGGGFLGGMVKDLAATADEFKNLEARIKLATGEGALFDAAFQGVAEIALRTNSALDETGTLFTKLAKAGQEAGKSAQTAQQEALGLTETINQTIQLSGGAADSAKAAIIQLIQGLQSGVLRGEEFNSVMEQAPRLATALANGLQVTTGELRNMANQGQLTADVVMKSLQGQAAVVAGEFDKLPPTVGRALQNLSSQWTLYVGAADSGLLSSANAAKVIDALAQNLDTLVNTLQTAGKLWAAMKIASLSADFGAWALKTVSATVAVEANTVAVGVNTAAQRSNAAAIAANVAAQTASIAATTASTVSKAKNASAWASIADFASQATGATKRATAATVAGNAAVVSKTGALRVLGGAVRGLTGLFGGPVGLAATLFMFRGELEKGAKSVVEWGMGFTEAGKQMKRYEESQRTATESQKEATAAAQANAAAIAAQAAKLEEARNQTFELSKQAAASVASFDDMRKKGDSAAEAISKIGKDFDLSNIAGIKNAGAVLDKLLADGKITAAEFQAAWAQALNGQDLAKFEVMARAAFSGAAREGERLAQLMDATVREAVKRTGLDFDQLQGKIGAASRSAINDVQAIVDGLQLLKDEGVDTGRVLTASLGKAIDTADSQQAIEALQAQIESLRAELGNTVTDGLLDQAREKAETLDDALDKATPGINSVAEAMKALGITSDASLKQTAATAKEAYDALKASGVASARELGEAFKKTAEAVIAANNGIAPSWLQAEAAARGYKIEVDAAGRATVKSMADAQKSVQGVGAAVRDVSADLRAMGIDAATASEQVKALAQAGQMLAAANQSRQDQRNADVEKSKYMNGPNTNPVDGVPTFNTKAEADAWLKAWKAQYERDNPFSTKRGGQLGNYMYDLTMFEFKKELDSLALRDAMKAANGGTSPGTTTNTPTPGTTTGKTVVINVEGVRRSINTDNAGADALQDLIRQLTAGKSTYQ